jgi:hypothetical protein
MLSEAQIESLAAYLVEGLLREGSMRSKAESGELVACVIELLSANFEEERRIEDEAEKIAEEQARLHPGVNPAEFRLLVKKRLAAQRGFVL